MHSADDLVMCLGGINGHDDRHIDGFYGVHGGYGVGLRNLERRMLLEFCLEKELCVSNLLWGPSITDDDDFLFNVEDTT